MADRISVPDLRRAIEMLLDRVEASNGPEVALTADYYWRVSPAVAFDPHGQPEAAIEAGQLSDDADELQELLRRGPSDASVWHDLSHVAALLGWLAARDLPSPS